jgi:hypothetical protein
LKAVANRSAQADGFVEFEPSQGGDPPIGMHASEPEGPGPVGAGPDGDVVGWFGLDRGLVLVVVLAVEVEARQLPKSADDADRFAEGCHLLARGALREPEGRELGVVAADAEAEHETAARESIEGLSHLGGHGRGSVGQAEHVRPYDEAFGCGGDKGEGRPWLEGRLVGVEVVGVRFRRSRRRRPTRAVEHGQVVSDNFDCGHWLSPLNFVQQVVEATAIVCELPEHRVRPAAGQWAKGASAPPAGESWVRVCRSVVLRAPVNGVVEMSGPLVRLVDEDHPVR